MRTFFFAVVLLLSACATTPLPINQGFFSEETPSTALEKTTLGKRVRWGGTLIGVTLSKEKTCFEVLSRPLGEEGAPLPTDATQGRFIACSGLFYDPAAYPAGRQLTISGTVQSPVICKIGDFERLCALASIEALHLWSKREPYEPHHIDPFWGHRNPFIPWRRH